MQKSCAIVGLLALLFLSGCSARPISSTWGHLKKGYNTTKQVYRATKAVAEIVSPLEYIYLSEHGPALMQHGEPFITREAMLGPAPDLGSDRVASDRLNCLVWLCHRKRLTRH